MTERQTDIATYRAAIAAKKASKNDKITKSTKTKDKGKCGHCQKTIGQKVAIQCEHCLNMNLVECLKDIEEGRIQDFIAVDDKFYCNKCISTIDVDNRF